jgi:hypothetical protein
MVKPLSSLQRQCIIAATIEPLVSFRRGYARDRFGPFFNLRTVSNLINRGALRVIRDRAGKNYLRLTARAA